MQPPRYRTDEDREANPRPHLSAAELSEPQANTPTAVMPPTARSKYLGSCDANTDTRTVWPTAPEHPSHIAQFSSRGTSPLADSESLSILTSVEINALMNSMLHEACFSFPFPDFQSPFLITFEFDRRYITVRTLVSNILDICFGGQAVFRGKGWSARLICDNPNIPWHVFLCSVSNGAKKNHSHCQHEAAKESTTLHCTGFDTE